MNIELKPNENKFVLVKDFSLLSFTLAENSSLDLKILLSGINKKNINITGKMNANSHLNVSFADFSDGNVNVDSQVFLLEDGANATWNLASLTSNNDRKNFNISFIHDSKNTNAVMNNYGVARDNSRLVFSGINHIKQGSKKSNTSQNAKIIVFDKGAEGKANPILKIDENDVLAFHAAIVGRLNDEHVFYLTSRGLNKDQAKALIVNGYLNPIANGFDEESKSLIFKLIEEKCHV